MRSLLLWGLLILAPICFAGGPGQVTETVIDKVQVREVVENSISVIARDYLYEQRSPEIISRLQSALDAGVFDRDFKAGRLKQTLEVALYRASGDSNFELTINEGASQALTVSGERANGAVENTLLDGNIGVIRFHGDIRYLGNAQDLHNAIAAIADSHAVIIDLRDVMQGSLPLTEQLLGYFMAPGTALADIHFAKGKIQHLMAPSQLLSGVFTPQIPVFILSSSFVTGPWELFAYSMQHADRALVVGEKTMGVATMTSQVPVSDSVRLRLSHAYFRHPVTQANWQDWGVDPDHPVTADNAQTVANRLARAALR